MREPGDFVTVEIGTYSVIIVRDDDEQVRAWHNVCRHRGARLLEEPAGSVGNIVCGYHKWTYGVDGALRHAGQQAGRLRPQLLRAQAGAHPQRGRPAPHLPGRRTAGGFRRRRRPARAVPARRTSCGGPRLRRGGHRRGRQLEAGDGEQPRVLPLRRPSRAVLLAVPHLRLRRGRRARRCCARRSTATCGRRRPAARCTELGLPFARIEELERRRPGSASSASRWTAPASPSAPTGASCPASCSATCRTAPRPTVDASSAQRVDPRPERPRVTFACCRWPRTRRWCDDLARARGRRRGRGLRRRRR